jgi:hypothetical protein
MREPPGGRVTLTIAAVNPLEHAEEIKQLFIAHERPEFPEFFDRAYPTGVRAGGVSWVGRDGAGDMVMHVACFPQRFRFGHREVMGALMMNLLVARPFRSFFPAHALIKRAKDDTRARGGIDFVYTDPNDQSKVVMLACGFAQVATLGRFVLPLGDRRWPVDRAIRLLHTALRVASGTWRGRALVAHRAAEFPESRFDDPPGASPRLRPYQSRARYGMRVRGYPGASDWWFTVNGNGNSDGAAAALLVRATGTSGVADLLAVRRDPHLRVAELIPDLAVALRGQACRRLQVWAVVESLFAAELRRAGFWLRERAAPIIATALTPAGETVLRAPHLWEITSLDCDR